MSRYVPAVAGRKYLRMSRVDSVTIDMDRVLMAITLGTSAELNPRERDLAIDMVDKNGVSIATICSVVGCSESTVTRRRRARRAMEIEA